MQNWTDVEMCEIKSLFAGAAAQLAEGRNASSLTPKMGSHSADSLIRKENP